MDRFAPSLPRADRAGPDLARSFADLSEREDLRRELRRMRPGENTIGPYRLLAPLGEGGMGAVFLAEHDETGQRVALKKVQLPKKELLRGIRREIKALARLQHPGIVRILDEGVHDGLPYYAMELLPGHTLLSWRDRLLSPSGPRATPGETLPQTEALPTLKGAWWTTIS